MEHEHQEEYRKLGLNISYYRKAAGLSTAALCGAVHLDR